MSSLRSPLHVSQRDTWRSDWRGMLWRFPLVFVPLMLLSGGVVGALYWNQAQTEQTVLLSNEIHHVRLQAETIVADFPRLVADLRDLAASPILQALIEENTQQRRKALEDEFRAFLENKQIYDHVRVIDASGRDMVRVNLLPGPVKEVAVPSEQPQMTKNSPYFAETMRLARGKVYVSPLELNLEEPSPKLTIRFGAPLRNARGETRGVLVLNYLGVKLLEKLPRNALFAAGQPLLVNADGYYLAEPRAPDESGVAPDPGKKRGLAEDFPEAWQRIAAAESSQFHTPRGIYTFRTVYPLRDVRHDVTWTATADVPGRYYWKIISHVRPERLQEIMQQHWESFVLVWLGLGVVFALAAWLVAWLSVQNRWARQQLLQRERLAAIGEAMTALAHESRNALQRSQAGLEMLKKRVKEDADSLELLGEVDDAQRYLTDLYEEVRGYAAPIQLRRANTDMQQLVRTIWQHLVPEQNFAKAELLLEDANVDRHCDVDPRAIGQVLRNVLENALSAAEKPQVRITWADDLLQGRPALRIVIRDNGAGLPPEDRERIFEPFFTTKLRGTGLGLAISRRIVEAHGGRIRVGDAPGPGAEIIITLPRSAP